MPAVGADGEVGPRLKRSVGRLAFNSHNPPTLFEQSGHFVLHLHLETRKLAARFGQKIQKVPLRHERDELAVRWKMRAIGNLGGNFTKAYAQLGILLVRPLKKSFQ